MITFNLRRATRFDGPNGWPFRRDAVADVVRRFTPDILATQEGTVPMLRDLDERLPSYRRVGGEKEAWPGEEPNAIFYDPARVRPLDAGVFWLSRRPLVVGSRSWGDWARRSALWALFQFPGTGGVVLVVNTHFDHVSMLSRRRSAQLVHRVAPEAIVMGDFNAWPRRFVHTVLLDGRVDPLAGARHTHNDFTRRDRGRIDWILVPEKIRVLRAQVLAPRRADGGPVSDHLPVLVDIDPASLPAPSSPAPPASAPRLTAKNTFPPPPEVRASWRRSPRVAEGP